MGLFMKLEVGTRVRDNYEYGLHKDDSRIGTIVQINHYLNNSEEWCHLIKWENGDEESYHPKYFSILTSLEMALK